MLRLLTKEEQAQSEIDIDNKILALPSHIKGDLLRLMEPIIKQLNCAHDFWDTDDYGNQFPAGKLICKHCSFIRNKIKP